MSRMPILGQLSRAAGVLVAVTVLVLGTAVPAAADHLVVEIGGPDAVTVGETATITVTGRWADTGEPAEGATVVFYAVKGFAGVTGEAELGSGTLNEVGVASFDITMQVAGVQTIRLDVAVAGQLDSGAISMPVTIGEQVHRPEAGIDIPGVGTWVVVSVVGTVWTVMLIATWWAIRVSRSPTGEGQEPSPRLTLAVLAFGVMAVFGVSMVTLFIRSPNTHSNLDPEGYNRTPLAFVEASYAYEGLARAHDMEDATAADGRQLFLSRGCAGCHGVNAEGAATAPSPALASREWLEQIVRNGLVGMPSYLVDELNELELDAIFAFLVEARQSGIASSPTPTSQQTGDPESTSFADDVLPIFVAKCGSCHGDDGGWTATDYASVMSSGHHAPVVIPGDVEDSELAKRVLGLPEAGPSMPPTGELTDQELRTIIDWIIAGASE